MSKDQETEAQIFEAAQKVFQRNGYAGARMQEIADEAGINKSMLHYYYRSKEKLFQAIFREGVREFFPKIFKVLGSDLDIKPKIANLVDAYYEIIEQHPHLPRFVLNEMNQHPEAFQRFIRQQEINIPESFAKQVRAGIEANEIRAIPIPQLVVNIVSLIIFPVIAAPMVQTLFNMDEQLYINFLKERKSMLPDLILSTLKPE